MKPLLSCLLLFTLPLLAHAGPGGKSKKPNILVIVADDLGYGDIGVHGGKEVPTPNIDKLAADRACAAPAATSPPRIAARRAPAFSPDATRRASAMNSIRTSAMKRKLGLPLDQRTIADLPARPRAMRTGLIGKWHQGFSAHHHPQSRGFDDFFGFLVGGHNYAPAQGRRGQVRLRPLAKHDLSRPRAAEARRLHHRPLHR